MEIIKKETEETISEYCTRVYNLKNILGLTWQDIAYTINTELGYNYSSDKYRKDAYKLNKILNEEKDAPFELSTVKLERSKLNDERAQINALYRRIAREETLKEIAKTAVESISDKIKLDLPNEIITKSKKVAILQLSDIHYGIDDETRWNKYNTEIAKQRIIKLQNKVIEYLQKENIDELYIVNLGDMIGGRIHLQLRINTRIDVVTQTIQISEILAEFTNNISKYAKIHCYFTTDNHGRLEPSIKDSIELESLSRIVPWFMQERLKENKNVIVHTDENYGDDIVVINVLGHTIACCHGHKDKPTKIVSNLTLYTKKHFDMILSSHFHHLAVEEENSTIVVYNGSIMSTDSYAEKLRLNSKPSQNLIICSEKDVMECLYKIDLSD